MSHSSELDAIARECMDELVEWGLISCQSDMPCFEPIMKCIRKSIQKAALMSGACDLELEMEVESQIKDGLFEQFWKEYPNKKGKLAACRKFKTIGVDRATLSCMIDAIREQKLSEQWLKNNGEFIPHPATWLNQGRWMDETTKKKKQVKSNLVKKEPTPEEMRGQEIVMAIKQNRMEDAARMKKSAQVSSMQYAYYRLSFEEKQKLAKL